MKSTLEREVTAPEIAEKEANETACGFRNCIGRFVRLRVPQCGLVYLQRLPDVPFGTLCLRELCAEGCPRGALLSAAVLTKPA